LSGEWFATETKPEMAMAENRRLAAARVLKGLTQRQLAEKVGTREIEISRIETCRVQPDAGMKHRIAEVLHKPAFEIFDC
jgi:transcriptional regulator with XRE-family HTH domain